MKNERPILEEHLILENLIMFEDTDLACYYVSTYQNYLFCAKRGILTEMNSKILYQVEGKGKQEINFKTLTRRMRRLIANNFEGSEKKNNSQQSDFQSQNELLKSGLFFEKNTNKTRTNSAKKHSNESEKRVPSKSLKKDKKSEISVFSPKKCIVIQKKSEKSESKEKIEFQKNQLQLKSFSGQKKEGKSSSSLKESEKSETAKNDSESSLELDDRYFSHSDNFCRKCGKHGHTYRFCWESAGKRCFNCLQNHSRFCCPSFVCRRCSGLNHIERDCTYSKKEIKSMRCPICNDFRHFKNCRTLIDYEVYSHQNYSNTAYLRCLDCLGFGHLTCKE